MIIGLRIAVAMAGALIAALGGAAAWGDDWPQKPVRLILPLGPGSATDVTARLFATRL